VLNARAGRYCDVVQSSSDHQSYAVDRLWPDPAADLDLDEAFADLDLPPAPPGRPLVGVNMVTSIDGRAQLAGRAEGLSGRADRRLLQLLRVAFDAVGSGVGTLRADDFYSHLPADLAARRVAAGRPAQPTAVVIGGGGPVPTDRRWFSHADQRRVLVLGADAPRPDLSPGTELLIAPTAAPQPTWVLEQLAERGIGSLLLEGGPTTNATFLAAGLIDELYWTIGARLLGTDALPMIAPIPGGSPWADRPREGQLVSIHRSGDELFVRYCFGNIGS
jgi:riboflavin biosynthesis pyrimidine reductase